MLPADCQEISIRRCQQLLIPEGQLKLLKPQEPHSLPMSIRKNCGMLQ